MDKVNKAQTIIPFKLDNSVYSLGQTFCGRDGFETDTDGNCSTKIKIVDSHKDRESGVW